MSSEEKPVPSLRPRPVVDRLPRYAAGKPASAVDGLDAFKLASNENPLPPLPEVLAAIAEQAAINRYPDSLATPLREKLGEYLGVPADDVVTGAGSLGALVQILSAFAGQNDDGRPDEVIYAWRSFEAYPICVQTTGAAPVPVPVLGDGRHDLDAMIAAITDQTKVIILCTPNNPTGPALTRAEVEGFLARVPSHILLVLDEAYTEFVRDPETVNGIDLYRNYPNVVVLRTLSKAHGLANLRVGYSVSQPHITESLRLVATPFAVSTLAQDAAVVSLENIDKVLARVEELVQERNRVVAALKEQGWDFPETQGNFVWLPLGERSPEFAAAADSQALSVRAFGTEGVRVSIGEVEANTRFLEIAKEFAG
ncbi:histidinol-phosphate transaminase [Neomicrococcus aestuarii]|uniref:Aromatic amino acid aminotransferase n=1 Tax=Neomicrococcus aestuarii TaxID=556325 RepID=A0A1L2ZP26_9MICC|nr:histidinol-phosphate transaminase [Neomicrococcus aestuarii]APF41114.1 aminotransferase [Neomicrococcus aestuarii]MBB5512966.1 histidinol-phosphate aminotransferase [Neomicrococcus aestuarii]